MAEKSRVKFNPDTKEIEVEGSESFVTTTLDKLLAMLSGAPAKKVAIKKEPKAAKAAPVKVDKKEPKAVKAPKRKPAKKVRPSEKAPKVATGMKRGEMSKSVIALINGSPEGISTAELKEKTGLKGIQIRNVLSSVTKRGKIRTVKRGVYVAA